MPVRGTTIARHEKLILVRDEATGEATGERIWCAWSDCDRYGYECYQLIVNEAKPGFPRKLSRYVFCCNSHLEYWRTSHIPGQYGKHQGVNRRFLLVDTCIQYAVYLSQTLRRNPWTMLRSSATFFFPC